jgi:hypothetical protein
MRTSGAHVSMGQSRQSTTDGRTTPLHPWRRIGPYRSVTGHDLRFPGNMPRRTQPPTPTGDPRTSIPAMMVGELRHPRRSRMQ